LFNILSTFATDQGFACEAAKDKYKAKIHILLENGEAIDLTARILKVDDEKSCVEFNKSGTCDSLLFFS
jgi:hypothetical protein